MKICNNCGNSFEGNFCNNCGHMNEENVNGQTLRNSIEIEEKHTVSKKKLGIIIGSVVTIICVAIASIVVAIGNSTYSQIVQAIDKGDYGEAYEVYQQKDIDAKEKSKLEGILISEIEELKNKYISKDIDCDSVISSMEKIKKFELSEVDTSADECVTFVEQLDNSRKNYELAIKFIESEDYKKAIEKYMLIWKNDPNYDTAMSEMSDAKEKYREKVLKEAEDFARNEDYMKATEVLENALEILANDADIEYKITVYGEEKINKEVEAILDEAEIYYENKNYQKALSVLDEGIKKYSSRSELVGKKTEYKEAVLNIAISEAEVSFETGGHIAAINRLNTYTDIVGLEEGFISKLDYYKSLEPVSIKDLEIFSSLKIDEVYDRKGSTFDCLGNEFVDYVEIEQGYVPYYAEELFLEYHIDGKYKYFTGRLGCGKKVFFLNSVAQEYQVNVYSDDILVYQSGLIGAKTEPISFNIDITNVKFLKIELIRENGSHVIMDQLEFTKY